MSQLATIPKLISRFGAAAAAAGLTTPALAPRPDAPRMVGCTRLFYAAPDASCAAPVDGRVS
jgi:hypothetical protein